MLCDSRGAPTRDIWCMVAAALGVSRGRQLCCGPAAQLRDEDGVDPAGSGQRQNLGAFGAPIVGTRCRLLEDGHDLVAGTFGERPQVPLLALARLIIGRDAAVDGHVSQLNPPRFRL